MRRYLLIFIAFFIAGCATSSSRLDIHKINAFSSENDNDGEFIGLEGLANSMSANDVKRLNIFYLHGIGRTEDPNEPPLGRTFMKGVANAYDLEITGNTLASQCGVRLEGENRVKRDFIEIRSGEKPIKYQTMVPGVELDLDRLVCMDRQILKVREDLEYVVYRIFWDEFLWTSLQQAHIGQDDGEGETTMLADLRRKFNRRLKDQMVNFGFSDAVMYVGPAGQEIRKAIKGAMCAAALDAGGLSFDDQGREITASRACEQALNKYATGNQFAFISESLGSKITFDLMREAMTDDRETIIDKMIAGSEIYMLANQLALLSLGDISTTQVKPAANDKSAPRPRIVALSEVNDFLTYEISPFFENVWALGNKGENQPLTAKTRKQISETLGFDFIDIRVEFADPLISIFNDFVDPVQAHAKHVAEPGLIDLMLCGATSGMARKTGCLAQNNSESQKDDS